MKKKNVSQLIIAIITVVLMIVIVGGSTFAYFQWTTDENQRTSVNVTIEQGRITMHIEPEKTVFQDLKPTANCNNFSAYGDALVTIINNTGTLAVPSLKLRAKVTKGGTDTTLTQDDLSYIHYAVVSVATTKDADGNAVKGETVTGSCSSPLTAAANGKFTNDELIATGTFSTVSTTGDWSDLPPNETYVDENGKEQERKIFLPRQYNVSTGTTSGVTFKAFQYATTHQYFRVYIWLDSAYTTTIVGNTVSDPLQNAKIEVSWSANSIVEQVSY